MYAYIYICIISEVLVLFIYWVHLHGIFRYPKWRYHNNSVYKSIALFFITKKGSKWLHLCVCERERERERRRTRSVINDTTWNLYSRVNLGLLGFTWYLQISHHTFLTHIETRISEPFFVLLNSGAAALGNRFFPESSSRHLSSVPPTGRVWHKALFRRVWPQGRCPETPGIPKNASGSVGIALTFFLLVLHSRDSFLL